jgi:hypothetical protein
MVRSPVVRFSHDTSIVILKMCEPRRRILGTLKLNPNSSTKTGKDNLGDLGVFSSLILN